MNKHTKTLEFLSVTEAAQYLGISRQHFTYSNPPEPTARIGKTQGWSKEVLDEWFAALDHKTGPKGPRTSKKSSPKGD